MTESERFRELDPPLEYKPYYRKETVPTPRRLSSLIIDKKYYVNYAGASYCDIDNNGKKDCSYCSMSRNDINIISIHDQGTSIRAIIVQDKRRKDIVLAYGGSDNISKLLESISKEMVDFPMVNQEKVQKYFHRSSNIVKGEIANHLKRLFASHPYYSLVITGHSLGGAIGTVAAPLIHRDVRLPYTQMRVITYGQLRVGNSYFATWYKNKKLDFMRVVNEIDEAANTPTINDGFYHVGDEVRIDKGIYYDCKTKKLENWRCSLDNTRFDKFVTDHEKVGDLALSPTECTGQTLFTKGKFVKVKDHETVPKSEYNMGLDEYGILREIW